MIPTKIEISHKTILFAFAVIAAIWVVLQVRDIIYLLFISFILMTALRPIIDTLARFKIPRVFSILLVYLILITLVAVSVGSTIPALIEQSNTLIKEMPQIVGRISPVLDIDIRSLTQQVAPITENVVRVTIGIFSNVLTVVLVLVFTFYMLLERRQTEGTLQRFMGEDSAAQIIKIVKEIEQRIGFWVMGQIILMASIGILVYIGLSVLHVDYALPLAILAGLLEIVPMIGPIASAIPAILIGLTVSPFLALSIAALFFIVQQAENHLIVPFIMKKSVGFSPLVTIPAILIGGRFAGITGALLAIPVVLVIQVIIAAVITHHGTSQINKRGVR